MRRVLLLIVGLLATADVFAQGATAPPPARHPEAGRPFVRNYGPREYKAQEQNWAILQDRRGVIYVGNNLGVLEYDGESWRLLAVPNKSSVRSLVMDETGRIYMGAVGDFGYLDRDDTGALRFVSLLDHVPQESRTFGDVWRTLATPDGIYFQARERLFRWSRGQIRVWEPKTRFNRASEARGVLYVGQTELGLMRMEGDELRLIPGGERFANEVYPVILPLEDGRLLIGTKADGVVAHDGTKAVPFPTEADDIFRTQGLYRGAVLPDGTLAMVTLNGGLVIVDQQGRRLQVVNKSTGLATNSVYFAYGDRQGAVWLGTDAGISRVETPSPLSFYDETSGFESGPAAIHRHEGDLYVATGIGVYRLRPAGEGADAIASFVRVSGIATQSWWFLSMTDPQGRVPSQLLVATGDGVYRIENDKATFVKQSVAGTYLAAVLHRSRKDPSRVWVGLFDGLASLRLVDGRWVDEGRVAGVPDEVRTVFEADDGALWLGTGATGVVRVDFLKATPEEGGERPDNPEVVHFGPDQGLPKGGLAVNHVAGRMNFLSTEEIYRFDSTSGRFVPDPTFKVVEIDATSGGVGLRQGPDGKVYVNLGRESAVAIPKGDGSYTIEKQQFRRFSQFSTTDMLAEADGVVWFAGRDGLVRFDSRVKKDYETDFPALVRRVLVNDESTVFAGWAADTGGRAGGEGPKLEYGRNALRFEFAAPSFDDESANEYQHYLEGLDKGWSEWGREDNRDYTNLPFGDYRFRVRARNLYGHIGQEAVYAFTILPPWYRTWWAYGLYLAALAAAVFGIDRFQRRRVIGKERERSRLREAQLRAESAEALAKAEGERIRSVELLSDIGKEITASLDFDTIFFRLHERVNQLVDASVFGVGLYHPEAQQIEYRLAVERGKRYAPYTRDTNDKNQFPVWCIEHRKPVFINDVEKEYGRYLSAYRETRRLLEDGSVSEEPRSLIYLPLMTQERVLGVITVQSFKKQAYTEYDLNLLQNLAAYTSIALDNADAYRQLNEQEHEIRQRAAELATVNSISQAISSKLEVEALIPLVGEQVRQVFDAQIAYLALLDKATNMIRFPYGFGDTFEPFPLGRGMTSRIIQTGEPLLINEDISNRAAQLNIARSGTPAKSYLGVPIPAGSEVIGVISVQSTKEEGRFAEADMRLLSTIASNVGVAIQNARLFEESRQARAVAEEADAAKSAFLSTVSHELRTPLTSVLGFAKIIKKRLEERIFPHVQSDDKRVLQGMQQVGDNLKVVVSEGERLTKLIDDVLDLAKIEAGKLEWHMESVTLPDIVDRATAATASLFEAKGLKLVKDVADDLPATIGDRDRLIQVVINLISNAVKFTDAGSVTCRAERRDGEIVVSVIDTGMGIAPSDQPKVFERFKQVGDTLTDKPKGTGLGLPICKEIVEHHAGRIWVESELGRGSTFAFALPLPAEKGAAPAPISLEVLVRQLREQVVVAAPSPSGRPANVLAVDDDPHIRELLKQEFGETGYRLRLAANGREALAEVRRERPDLVILDVMMPEINGFDVAAVLKNDPQTMDIPIIILSIVEDKERGFRLGVDRYLTKPIDTALLFREVDTLIAQGSSRRRVLVVDEDATTVKTLTDVLRTRGYSVVEAQSRDLVAKAIELQPDIIMLNSLVSEKQTIVQSLRFEKGLENVVFLVYQ